MKQKIARGGGKLEKVQELLETARPHADNRDRHREQSENKRKGHGRNGAEAYRGATTIKVRYDSLKPGNHCPECQKGQVYHNTPGYLARIVGQAPLAATG